MTDQRGVGIICMVGLISNIQNLKSYDKSSFDTIQIEHRIYELYQKYSILMLDLLFQFRQDEDNQQLNPREENAYIPFEVIIDFQQQLLKDFQTNPTYEKNQDL